MRHSQILQGGERWNVSAQGEYIHYEKGAGEIEIEVNGEMHLLAIRDTYIVNEGYIDFKVLNLDESAGEFVFRTGKGDLKVAASGQITEVSGIASTVNVDVLNSIEISKLPSVEVLSLPDVVVSDLPDVEVKSLSNLLTETYSVEAGAVVLIPARQARKRLVIQGYSEATDTTICRVSDSSKETAQGQYLAVGGGLMTELEHKHSAAVKVWNTSNTDKIEVIAMEEF